MSSGEKVGSAKPRGLDWSRPAWVSMTRASRAGVRETPRSLEIWVSVRRSPGAERTGDDALAEGFEHLVPKVRGADDVVHSLSLGG